MGIVVGHDINPDLIPYEAAYQMQLGQNAQNQQGSLQAQAAAENAHLRPTNGGADLMAVRARDAAGKGPDTYAGMDWQTPIKVYHPDGAGYDSENMTGGGGARYDTLYQSQGADPMAAAAGVAGASRGFGMLGSREQTVYDQGIEDPNNPTGPRKYIDVNDAGEVHNLEKTLDQTGGGQRHYGEDDYATMFLSPEEQKQRAANVEQKNYERKQGVLQGGRQQLQQAKALQRASEIKTQAANKAAQIAQTYGLKGELEQTALAAELERQQMRLDQDEQHHQDNMTMAGGGSIDAARQLINEFDNMSPEQQAIYGKDAGTRIAAMKAALMAHDNHAANEEPAVAAAVAKGLFQQLKNLEAAKSQQKELDFKEQREKALEDRAAASAAAKISAADTAQTNRLAAQDHAAQLQAAKDRDSQDYNVFHSKMVTDHPSWSAEQVHAEVMKQLDLKKQGLQNRKGDQSNADDVLQQDLPQDHPSLAMVETLAKSLKDAGVPLDKAREIIAARLGEQSAA